MKVFGTASLGSNITGSYKKIVHSIKTRFNLKIKIRFPGQKQKRIKVSEMSLYILVKFCLKCRPGFLWK